MIEQSIVVLVCPQLRLCHRLNVLLCQLELVDDWDRICQRGCVRMTRKNDVVVIVLQCANLSQIQGFDKTTIFAVDRSQETRGFFWTWWDLLRWLTQLRWLRQVSINETFDHIDIFLLSKRLIAEAHLLILHTALSQALHSSVQLLVWINLVAFFLILWFTFEYVRLFVELHVQDLYQLVELLRLGHKVNIIVGMVPLYCFVLRVLVLFFVKLNDGRLL